VKERSSPKGLACFTVVGEEGVKSHKGNYLIPKLRKQILDQSSTKKKTHTKKKKKKKKGKNVEGKKRPGGYCCGKPEKKKEMRRSRM